MGLKRAMEDVGLSNEGLGALVGVPGSRIAAYKSGGRRMGIKTARRIAEFVDADPAEMVAENRLAAMKRAAEKGDARGALNAVKSIVNVSGKSAEGAADEDLDGLVTWAVKFAEKNAVAAAGCGMEDGPLHD